MISILVGGAVESCQMMGLLLFGTVCDCVASVYNVRKIYHSFKDSFSHSSEEAVVYSGQFSYIKRCFASTPEILLKLFV